MTSKAKIIFHGAAQTVTGSMHSLQFNGWTVAMDCGLYQGHRLEAAQRNRSFPVPADKIDAVVLSHAHIDHSGNLPTLVKSGFEGTIYATPATRDLCAVMLQDSAHIQQEDVRYLNKKLAKRGEKPVEPLYDGEDATATMQMFHSVGYGRWFEVFPGLRARFHDAGHILGSAMIELRLRTAQAGTPSNPTTGATDGNDELRILFSGDLGRPGTPILKDPAPMPACDVLICESTYGGRCHLSLGDMKEQLRELATTTINRGGKLIIPAFSVGRTQTLVYYFHELINEQRLPEVPIYIDSPLSVRATSIFRMHPECYDAEARRMLRQDQTLFGFERVHYITDVEQSKKLHRRRKPCIIISASGMCEAGRILHHLKNNITSAKNTVLIVGYAAPYTLARRLVEGESKVRILGATYKVRAEVAVLNGLSSHADAEELKAMILPLKNRLRQAFFVHGDPDQCRAIAEAMQNDGLASVTVPEPDQSFELA